MALKVVILGGSAGSLDVLLEVLPAIKSTKLFSYIIVLHRKESPHNDILTRLLASKCSIQVKEVEDKEKIYADQIYIAPAGYHLFIEKDASFSLDVSEKVNYSRPSIDVSFSMAAEAFHKDLIGILLSGANADGTQGLHQIKHYGGVCIAQDPQTTRIPNMPEFAIKSGVIDFICTPQEIKILLENPQAFLSQK